MLMSRKAGSRSLRRFACLSLRLQTWQQCLIRHVALRHTVSRQQRFKCVWEGDRSAGGAGPLEIWLSGRTSFALSLSYAGCCLTVRRPCLPGAGPCGAGARGRGDRLGGRRSLRAVGLRAGVAAAASGACQLPAAPLICTLLSTRWNGASWHASMVGAAEQPCLWHSGGLSRPNKHATRRPGVSL